MEEVLATFQSVVKEYQRTCGTQQKLPLAEDDKYTKVSISEKEEKYDTNILKGVEGKPIYIDEVA